MNHALKEEEKWDSISKNVLVLSGEHFSFWLLKSFVSGWTIDGVLRETAHRLCNHLLMFSPCVEDIPEDADFERLSLYAIAEFAFHFSTLVDRNRPQLSINKIAGDIPVLQDDDLCSLLTFGRILCRHYSLIGNTKALHDVKAIVVDTFALIYRSRQDDTFSSILRDIWLKFSASEFGDFNKMKSKRPSQENLKKLIIQIANDVMTNKLKSQPPSVLFQIFNNAHQDLVLGGEGASTSVAHVIENDSVVQSQPESSKEANVTVNVNVATELPISALDIGNVPNLSAEELSKLHSAFDRAGAAIPEKPPTLDDKLICSVRRFFEENSHHKLVVRVPPVPASILPPSVDLPAHPVATIETTVSQKVPEKPKPKKPDLTEPKKARVNLKRSADTTVAPLQATGGVNQNTGAAVNLSVIHETSMSPSFSECMIINSPRKSPRKTAPVQPQTAENNAMIRALVRGVASRLNAKAKASDSSSSEGPRLVQTQSQSSTSLNTAESVVVNLSAPVVVNRPPETAKASKTPSAPATQTSQDARSNNSTPSVAVQPRLKERIGAPDLSSSSSDVSSISSEESVDARASNVRKKRRPWTKDEYIAIQKGVKLFGEGKWREIQMHYPELRRRTNVAVKDAWRLILKNPHLVAKNK